MLTILLGAVAAPNAAVPANSLPFGNNKLVLAISERKSKGLSKTAIFEKSTSLFEKPLTISQISFETKKPIENHMMMCGDAAGMIHPLCGNGMSMAIQSAQIASKLILNYLKGNTTNRDTLEKRYIMQWNAQFKWRLKAGHFIAMLFRNDKVASILLQVLKRLPFLLPVIIKQTHGKPIDI